MSEKRMKPMPWNDALAWTIMSLLSVLLAVMGWDTLKQTINDRKEKNDKERKQ